MNAPEKVYFTSTEDGTHYYTEGIPFEREYVEYVRTDALIEKASEWVKNKAERYIVETSLCSYFDYKRAVEDFVKYMKGE